MSNKLSVLIKDLEESISDFNKEYPDEKCSDPRIIVGVNVLKGIFLIWGDLEVATNTLEWIIKYEDWKYDIQFAHNKVVYGKTKTYGESCNGVYTGLHWKNIGNVVVVNDTHIETEFDLTTDGVNKKLERKNNAAIDILSIDKVSDHRTIMITPI